jgi:hypothetical protein
MRRWQRTSCHDTRFATARPRTITFCGSYSLPDRGFQREPGRPGTALYVTTACSILSSGVIGRNVTDPTRMTGRTVRYHDYAYGVQLEITRAIQSGAAGHPVFIDNQAQGCASFVPSHPI